MVRLVGVTSSMGPCTMLPNTHTTLQMEWNGDRNGRNIKNEEYAGTQVEWNGDSRPTEME